MTELEQEIAPQVRVMQTIWGALAAGIIVFGVVSVVALGPEEPSDELFVTANGLFFGALELVISTAFGFRLARNAAHLQAPGTDTLSETMSLAAQYQTGMIIGLALNEGGAFFNLICYQVEGSPWSLVAAGVLLTANLLRFPSVGGVARWIEQQQRDQRDESSLG